MSDSKLLPAVITALKSKAHMVRQAASDLGLEYEETAVLERDDLTRFRFKPMDDVAARRLVAAVPREVYAYRAIVGGTAPGCTGSE